MTLVSRFVLHVNQKFSEWTFSCIVEGYWTFIQFDWSLWKETKRRSRRCKMICTRTPGPQGFNPECSKNIPKIFKGALNSDLINWFNCMLASSIATQSLNRLQGLFFLIWSYFDQKYHRGWGFSSVAKISRPTGWWAGVDSHAALQLQIIAHLQYHPHNQIWNPSVSKQTVKLKWCWKSTGFRFCIWRPVGNMTAA